MLNIKDKELYRRKQSLDISNDMIDIINRDDGFYEKHIREFGKETDDPLEICYNWLWNTCFKNHANKNEYFLDVGCGCGITVFRMERAGFISSGIEPSPYRLGVSDTLQILYKDKNVMFYPGLGQKLPFTEKWFDIANSTMVLENTRSPYNVLREMVKVAKIVTGIVHNDDQEGSPHHTHHLKEADIVEIIEHMMNYKIITGYEYNTFNEGHSKCTAFILYTKHNNECVIAHPKQIVSVLSMRKHIEDSYYEAIMKYGKRVVECPIYPINVEPIEGGYQILGDGIHRLNALKRTDEDKIKIRVNR